jgi:hypothetical protein
MQLLGGPYVFGTPTSTLYRSDLIRRGDSFYPNSTPEADTSACYKCLQETDFGFVHQVLSYERVHENTISRSAKELNAYLPSKINDLLVYGSSFMSRPEAEQRLKDLLKEYYRFLAVGAVNFKGGEFWAYHKGRLREFGYPLNSLRLGKAVSLKVLDLLLNPMNTIEILVRHTKAGKAQKNDS